MKRLFNIIRYWLGITPKWSRCVHASCWQGRNAGTRHMNILSPHFTDAVFKERVKWARKRGCDTLHLFLANRRDGEGAGYSIYGDGWPWSEEVVLDVLSKKQLRYTTSYFGFVSENHVKLYKRRIKYARRRGMGVVLWLMADDSRDWARAVAAWPERYMRDLKATGLLGHASTVVVGLETDEYWNGAEVAGVVAALREVYRGKIGVHMTSGRTDFAQFADIMFYQVSTGRTARQIEQETLRALSCGKPVNFFELDRHENRELAQAALDAGAFGTGNW